MRAKKSFGQHFLVDPSVAQRMVAASMISPLPEGGRRGEGENDIQTVGEVGPGTGALPKEIVAAISPLPEGGIRGEGVEDQEPKPKRNKDRIVGIEIHATPPGKKMKALNLLSGGERALTSIALISAIMATNPSPFVVLDEVDAALDEANTLRFAAILEELREHSQFIVITHNRATMEKSDIIYGVTMGDDGISSLLSVSLEDVEKTATARR